MSRQGHNPDVTRRLSKTDRQIVFERGLYRLRAAIKQSSLLILSDKVGAVKAALTSVSENRKLLEDYIRYHPIYEFSLVPLETESSAPKVVKMAVEASREVGVGPMAAIPGALADLALEAMVAQGSSTNLVENGGEIAAKSSRPLKVGIYAGGSPLSGALGFLLSAEDFPIGISTSSATVSHAINFGESDATVIIADSASLADAVATAASNAVKGRDVANSIQAGLTFTEKIKGVRGALIIRGEHIGTVGEIPEILKLEGNLEELFKADLYDSLQVKI